MISKKVENEEIARRLEKSTYLLLKFNVQTLNNWKLSNNTIE